LDVLQLPVSTLIVHHAGFAKPERKPVVVDTLEKPLRYNQGRIEVWDFILDQKMGYLEGCAIKYLCRFRLKGGVEDLKKARVYLDKLIEVESKK